MSFASPWVLAFLLIPLALAAWETRRGSGTVDGGGGRVPMPFDAAPLRRRRWTELALLGAAIIPALILAVVVVLLAGPRRLGPPSEERVLTNIDLLLDVSGSMGWPMAGGEHAAGVGAGPSRYAVAMEAINEFTSRRKGDAFGLTIFGGEVVRWVPLTKDLSAIRNATPFLDPKTLPHHLQSTRIGHALRFSNAELARQPEGDRLIILLSDGMSSDLGGGNARAVGEELRDNGVVVHTVNIGDGPPPAPMSEIVTPTGGQVFSAPTPDTLAAIFEHIDRMQPVRVKPTQPEPIDFFRPFALAGLALLVAHQLCLFGLRYTPW